MLRFVTALAFVAAAPSTAKAPDRSIPRAGHQSLEQREHVSIVDEGGTGTAVILVPGLSTSREVWRSFVPGLRRRHHIYTVQVNGFGGDDPRGNLRSGILAGITSDLDRFIIERKVKSPAFVGHSTGGLIAMMMLKAHPMHVGRLLVVDSLPYIGDLFGPGVTVAQVEPQAKAMSARVAAAYGKPRDEAALKKLADSMAMTPVAQSAVADLIAEADARVSAQTMYEAMTTDLRPDVANFRVPIMVVYPASGDTLYRSAYAAAPNVRYSPVVGAGHFVMLDKPAAFEEALVSFLK